MPMTTKALGFAAGGLILLGLALGLWPVSASSNVGTSMSCGSGWFADNGDAGLSDAAREIAGAMYGKEYEDSPNVAACADVRSLTGWAGGIAAGLGVVIFVGLGFLAAAKNGQARATG